MASRKITTGTSTDRAALARSVSARLDELDTEEELSFEELADWSLEDMLDYLRLHDVELDVETMRAQIQAELGADYVALQRGDPMDGPRLQRLLDKVQNAVRKVARKTAKATMRQARMALLIEEGVDFFVWVAKMRRTCRSCEDRHGYVQAFDAWEHIGLPGEGSTLCGDECECSLVAVPGATREDTKARLDDVPPG